MVDNDPRNTNIPDLPEPTQEDQRLDPDPTQREGVEREADRLARKGIETEQKFDQRQRPFTK